MKKLTAMCLLLLCAGWQMAKADTDPNDQDVTSYQVVVYQNDDNGEKFTEQWSQQLDGLTRNNTERGFLGDLFTVTKATGAGLITGQVTSLITTGVAAIGELTKSRKNKWQNVMKKANTFETTLMMLQNLEDFYSAMSTTSAMDPSAMSFDGIGCLQMRGRDTVLYLSCHLDTSVVAISRIFRHSKFQLRLDTLVFNPVLCDLPNDSALKWSKRQHFDFDQREGAVVDYHFSQITRDDVADIMLGRQSDRLPKVIHSTENSNVFFFWSGHGGQREGPLWGNEDASEYFGTQRIHDIVEQMGREFKYRRMLFAIETCFSGNWGVALQGLPNVLAITAANTRETSDADVHDKTLGVFLSNAFARTFRNEVGRLNTISIYDLYKELARTTIGSHVTLYNQEHYGSVYTNTMREYFPYLEAE